MSSSKQSTQTKSGTPTGKATKPTGKRMSAPSMHSTKRISVPEGVSAFAIAMCEYQHRLRALVEQFGTWEYLVDKRDADFFSVKNVCTHCVPRIDKETGKQVMEWRANLIVLEYPDGSTRDYKVDVVHYGPRVDEVYEHRGWGVYKKLGLRPAFQEVQRWAFVTFGLYLVDLSEGKQDIRLYKRFEDLPPLKRLWHGFDRIFLPRAATDAAPTVDAEGFTTVAGGGEGAPEPEPAGGAGSGATVADIEDDIERLAAVQGKAPAPKTGRQGKSARKDRAGH